MPSVLKVLVGSPALWIAVAIGLVGAWLAGTLLPSTLDRASIGESIFVISALIGVAVAFMGRGR